MKSKTDGADGLEAWGVALSACFINFVMAGLGRMSGILYVAFIDIFQVSRLEASVPFSARSLARNFFGPLVGIIGQKYGVRTTTLIGGIIGTLSALFCFYAQRMVWITILWGVLNGAGAALSITLPQVVLNQHFKKYRTTASGMAFSGCCFGSFLFPVLLEYFIKNYGLGGSFLLISGIIMNVIPAAMMLRKPSWLEKKSKVNVVSEKERYRKYDSDADNTDNKTNQNVSNKDPREHLNKDRDVLQEAHNNECQKIMEYSESKIYYSSCRQTNNNYLRDNKDLIIKLLRNSNLNAESYGENILHHLPDNLLQKYLDDFCKLIDVILQKNYLPSEVSFNNSSKDNNKSDEDKLFNKYNKNKNCEILLSVSELKQHMNIEFYDSLTLQLDNFIKHNDNKIPPSFSEEERAKLSVLMEQLKNIFSLLNNDKNNSASVIKQDSNSLTDKEKLDKHPNTFAAHIKTTLKLHKNPLFLLISLSRSAHFLTFVLAITILVDFSIDKGLSDTDGKYVIFAISLGDLLGRLCLGWITDKEYISLPRYMLLVMVMQGACTASLNFMNSKPAFLFAITAFGLLQGSLFVRHPVLVSKYLDSNEQSVAMGCLNFFSGLLGFALPNYIGYFRDTIGSYNCIFYINGAIGTTIGIMWAFEPYFVKRIKSVQETKDEPV